MTDVLLFHVTLVFIALLHSEITLQGVKNAEEIQEKYPHCSPGKKGKAPS